MGVALVRPYEARTHLHPARTELYAPLYILFVPYSPGGKERNAAPLRRLFDDRAYQILELILLHHALLVGKALMSSA